MRKLFLRLSTTYLKKNHSAGVKGLEKPTAMLNKIITINDNLLISGKFVRKLLLKWLKITNLYVFDNPSLPKAID